MIQWIRDHWVGISLSLILCLTILPWGILWAVEEGGQLSFIVFDVGQGDAIWIETPDRYQVLIDGGPNARVIEKLGSVMGFWDREIDLLVLTHPHADHLTGLLDVLDRYTVGAVIDPDAEYDTAEYALWEEKLAQKKIPRYRATAGMEVAIGKYATLSILSPMETPRGRLSNVHDANIVSELSFGDIEFLLTGDAEAKLERALLSRGRISDIEVLKVGHHGSKTSSSDAFLSAARPEFAVISAGKNNRYGHPHPSVLERLEAFGIEVFRTDIVGNVHFTTDGAAVR